MAREVEGEFGIEGERTCYPALTEKRGKRDVGSICVGKDAVINEGKPECWRAGKIETPSEKTAGKTCIALAIGKRTASLLGRTVRKKRNLVCKKKGENSLPFAEKKGA